MRTPQQASREAREAREAWEENHPIQSSTDRLTWTDFTGLPEFDNVDVYWRPKPIPFLSFHKVPVPHWATHGAVWEDGEIVFSNCPLHHEDYAWIRDDPTKGILFTGTYVNVDNWYESQVCFR